MTGMKGRDGLFPASVCVKVKGTYVSPPRHTLIVRTCAADSHSLTMDTEIARIEESCGLNDFDADATWEEKPTEESTRRMDGCIAVCDSVDGCNGANGSKEGGAIAVIMMLTTLLINSR